MKFCAGSEHMQKENREGRAEFRSTRCNVREKEVGLLYLKDCFVW